LNTQNKAPFLRRRLGRRLRTMREAAGLSLDQAAERLDKKRSALHRIETGMTKADVHFVRSVMDIYDEYDPHLLDQTREAAKPLWFRAYGISDMGYVDVETFAVAVKEFPGLNLPGLLQTEDYVRAMLGQGRHRRTDAQVANDVRVRLIRQQRLVDSENPLDLVAIVDEAALRRAVGGPEVMRSQLRHLIQVTDLQTVSLQVLPLSTGAHSSMDGAFTLLSFLDPQDPEMLYVEYPTGALHIEDEKEVAEARLKFENLRSEALSPADSLVLIERIIGER
jgi:transcriptional regulator with XRE-family HTH domain